jgi:diketogulonate reductase-like aldo/keto reductase
MTRRIKMTNGNLIPNFGLGTWQLKGQQCVSTVKEAIEIGYDHIDTADAYENHTQIRKALQYTDREKLFITTKIPKDLLDRPSHHVDRYFDELGVDYLDLVLLHWPNRSEPMAENLLEIQEMDRVKSVGVSNFSIELIKQVMAKGFNPVVNQVEFHPYLNQKELLAVCNEQDIVLTAYSPLARGKVIGDSVLSRIGINHNASEAQISLAWILSKNVVVIPKASSRKHLQENFNAMKIELSDDEIAEIDALDQSGN